MHAEIPVPPASSGSVAKQLLSSNYWNFLCVTAEVPRCPANPGGGRQAAPVSGLLQTLACDS